MISKKEVEHIAKLARLELADKEVVKMQKDLTEILGYFDLLKKVPEIKIQTTQKVPQSKVQNLRNDEVKLRDASLAEKLIAAAPDKKEDYIKVKIIL